MLPRLVAAVLAVCLALAAAMAAAQEAATDPSPTALPAPPPAALQVGLPDLGRPLAYRGADGEPAGLLVELWRMVEPELGELNITLCGTASACLVDLEAQLLDLAGPMDLGAGGAARYSQPVLSLAMGAVTPGVGEQDARALRLARVGVLERRSRGTADAAPPGCPTRDCRAVRRWHPDEVRLVEEEAAVAALGDRYDVIVGPYAALRRLFASGGPAVQLFPVWRHWQYVAARANDGDRLAAAEAAFKALPAARLAALEDFATAFGDIDQLARMHDVPALSFDEKRFIDEHPTVYLGASLWEPLTVQRGTALTGLGIDSVRYHLRRIGVTPVFELRSWEEIVELATRGRLDGVGYVVSSARFQRGFVFTDSVIQAPFVAVIGPAAPFVGSIDDIAELRAAVRAEYEPLRYAIDAAFPDLELTETDGPEAALDALLAGRVDAWLEFLPVVRSTALARPDAETRALRSIDTGLFSSVSMALNVESGLTPLVDLVNRSINSAGSGLQEVQRHWLAGDAPVPPRRWTWLWFMLLSLVLAAGCAHLVRALVRERVRLRRSEAALRRAQLLSGVGSLEIPPPYRRVTLNGDTPRLLGLSREVTEQSLAEHLALFTDEDATLLDAMLETT